MSGAVKSGDNTVVLLGDLARANELVCAVSDDAVAGRVAVSGEIVIAARALLDQVDLLVTRTIAAFEESGGRAGTYTRDVGDWLQQNTTGGRGKATCSST